MTGKTFDSATIDRVLSEMGRIAVERGMTLEIAVYGGSALALVYQWREATHDVDFMPVRGDVETVRAIADQALRNLGLPEGGFRPDVEIFRSDNEEVAVHGEFPPNRGDAHGIRVFTASPRYLLAMKVLSMRSSLETEDARDVWHLLDACGIDSADEAVALAARFYPDREVPVRNRRLVEDIVEAKRSGQDYDPGIAW